MEAPPAPSTLTLSWKKGTVLIGVLFSLFRGVALGPVDPLLTHEPVVWPEGRSCSHLSLALASRPACVGAAPLRIASSFQLILASVQAAFRRTYLPRILSSYRSYRCDQVSFYRFYGTSPALLLACAPPMTSPHAGPIGSGFCARPE